MSESHDFLILTKEEARKLYNDFFDVTQELRDEQTRKKGRVVGFQKANDDYDLDREVFNDKDDVSEA